MSPVPGRADGSMPAAAGTRRLWLWVLVAAAVTAAAAAAAIVLALQLAPAGHRAAHPAYPATPRGIRRPGPGSSPPPSPGTAPPPSPAAGPRAVFGAYIAAINRHDWPAVWQLGGKNLGLSYAQMVAGYHLTARDAVTSLSVHGHTVTARILAYETTGPVQTYALRYVITGGVIVAAHQTLLGTSG